MCITRVPAPSYLCDRRGTVPNAEGSFPHAVSSCLSASGCRIQIYNQYSTPSPPGLRPFSLRAVTRRSKCARSCPYLLSQPSSYRCGCCRSNVLVQGGRARGGKVMRRAGTNQHVSTPIMASLWPLSVRNAWPVSVSHTTTVLSFEPQKRLPAPDTT